MLDEHWRLASGIELYADLEPDDERHLGMVLARAHATGWFFSAHHPPGLDAEELTHLAEFAKVRVYLLLTEGPTPTTWVPGPRPNEWIARSFTDGPDVASVVPDAVPASWR